MKKSIFYLVAIMALVALADGCQKIGLEIIPEEPAVEPERTDGLPKGAFRLTTEGDGVDTKVMVSGTIVNWVEGDVVNVNGNDYAIKYANKQFYIEPGADGTPQIEGNKIRGFYNCDVMYPGANQPRVDYPNEYVTEVSSDNKQKISLPMVAYGNTADHNIQFKHITAALLLTVKNETGFPVKLEEVILSSSTSEMGGYFFIDLTAADYGVSSKSGIGAVKLSIFNNVSSKTKCEIPNEQSITVQVPFRPVSDASINILVRANSNLGAVRGFHGANQDSDDIMGVLNPNYEFRYSYTPTTTLTLGRNQTMTASVTIKRAAESTGRVTEVDHGLFSISNYYKVHFSKGNLKYYATASAGERWQFADNQYNYVGNVNVNITQGENNPQPIDLFGWATSGHNNGQQYYQPYSYSDDDSGYYGNSSWWNGDRPNSMDWGYNLNILPNNISKNIIWYTLGADAWTYLLGRNEGNKWGYGTVAGVIGCILLPDDWVQPAGVPLFKPQNTTTDYNNYAVDEWAFMAKAGAVFLPAAGWRECQGNNEVNKVVIYQLGQNGYYWTCDYESASEAKYLSLGGSSPVISTSAKSDGFSVRLVTRLDGSN